VVPDWSASPLDRRALVVGLAAAVLQLGAGRARASADPAFDIQLLQTAASVENVLVSTYETLLAVPFLSGPNANLVLKAMLTTARAQHSDHASACNELATRLGGGAQNAPNAGLSQVVARARPGSSDLGAAVELALQLEIASAQTYQNHVGLLGDVNARRLAASILGIEAQHVGLLRLAQALVGARTPELLSLESGVGERIPPEAATAGFPESFSKSDQARPPTEGAVR
jgi:hypothetical protein